MIIIVINRFIIIVNFRNLYDKAIMEIFQLRRALDEASKQTNTLIQFRRISETHTGILFYLSDENTSTNDFQLERKIYEIEYRWPL